METTNILQEAEELKAVIKKVFGVDINLNTRKRAYVDARRVYAKLLRDQGYSLESIGRTIGKDHATIIHYIKSVEHIFVQDNVFFGKYAKCRNIVFKNINEDSVIKSSIDYQKISIDLDNKIEELREKYLKLSQKLDKYCRIESIIEMIDSRTPEGSEELVERKIRTMFNGLKLT
jgi:hypothetical protein